MNGLSRFKRRVGFSIAAACAAAVVSTPSLRAYALIGGSWPTGNITMQLQLDASKPSSPSLPLTDGSNSWNAVAQAAMMDWNAILGRSQFSWTTANVTTGIAGDRVNNVFFATTIYGDAFDQYTLAVTIVDNYDSKGIPTAQIHDADLIVNANRTWNSYRGAIRSSPVDLRRVLLHELGHVIGLDHPDEVVPAQAVTAIMNSSVSSLETLQTDDINGAKSLYNTSFPSIAITKNPVSKIVNAGGSTALTLEINNSTTLPDPSPLLQYNWYFSAVGSSSFEKLFTVKSANLNFGTAQMTDAGSYYVEVMTPDQTLTSSVATLTVNATATNTSTTLFNLSSRGIAGSGSETMIVGFVVAGPRAKTVLVRSVGPSLTSYNIAGPLADPKLTLYSLKDPANPAIVATSLPKWDQDPSTATSLRDTMNRVGAFPLAANSKDAVIVATLAPGNYSAQTSSPTGQTGVVLVEAYDADNPTDPTSRLSNLSTRGNVGTGENILIAGFSVQGPGAHTYLIRAVGPTLSGSPYNVSNTLYDPYLKLYSMSGAAPVLIRETDDWDSPSTTQPALKTAFTQVGAFDLTVRRESVMLVTLQPGNYSAQASGNDNEGHTSVTGNAIIEIYEVP